MMMYDHVTRKPGVTFTKEQESLIRELSKQERTMATKLIYIGRGDAFVGVPARNLTEKDFTERAETFAELGITESVLIASGLYKAPEAEPKKKPTRKGSAYLDAAKEGE
jgi:hypothetical protein